MERAAVSFLKITCRNEEIGLDRWEAIRYYASLLGARKSRLSEQPNALEETLSPTRGSSETIFRRRLEAIFEN